MLRPLVLPGLPVQANFVSGMLTRAPGGTVTFRRGLYPGITTTAPVGEYLKALWDPRSEALITCVKLPMCFVLS